MPDESTKPDDIVDPEPTQAEPVADESGVDEPEAAATAPQAATASPAAAASPPATASPAAAASPPIDPGYTAGGVPTFESVREKIETRYGASLGAAELDAETPEGRSIEEQYEAR